jgi:iron complex outermembrane receptor protein
VTGLQDIVVTARRVQERLQDVPLSVQALDSEQLDNAQIRQVLDLKSQISNLNTNKTSTPGNAFVSIRGQSSGSLPNISLDNRVGVYLDGVYIARTQGSSFTLADIDRVEVLKGPQGTLFGRNTTGGTINFVTSSPSGNFSGIAEAGLGNFGRNRYRLSIDLPSFGPFSLRVGYVHDDLSGDIRNLAPGRTYGPFVNAAANYNVAIRPSVNKFGGFNNDSYFAALGFESGAFRADLKGDYADNFSYDSGLQNLGFAGNFVGCAGAALALGVAPNCATVMPVAAGGVGFPLPLTSAAANNVPISFTKLNAIPQDLTAPSHIKNRGVSLTMNYEVSDAVTLRSISGYRRLNTDAQLDLDGGDYYVNNDAINLINPGLLPAGGVTPYCLSCSISHQQQKQVSEEFQVLAKTGSFDFLAGLFYFRETGSSSTMYTANYSPAAAALGFSGIPPLSTTAPNVLSSLAFTNGDVVAIRSVSRAVFGRATWHAGDKFDLVVGARYTQDRKRNTIPTIIQSQVDLDGNAANGIQNPPLVANANFNKFTYEGTATYKFTPDINVFARYATAYLAGGLLRNVPFNPETTKDIEVGLKSEFFDRRVRFNLTGFAQTSKNNQIPTNSGPFGTLVVVNVGSLKTKGFEAELTVAPVTGLTVSANAGYTNQKYSDGRRNLTPNWTLQYGGQYDTPKFNNGMFLSLQADANYRSHFYSNAAALQTQQDGTPLPLALLAGYANQTAYLTALDAAATTGGYWLANTRISLVDIPFGGVKGRISGFVRNVFNERHVAFAQNFGTSIGGFFEQDRTYGIDLQIKF